LFFQIASEEKDSILGNIPIELKEKGSMLYTTLLDGKLSLGLNYINFLYAFQGGLQNLIKSIKEQDPDKVSIGLASSLDTVAELELLQVLSFTMLVFIQANVVLDGYSTPLTSGNFAKLDGELPVLPLSVYGAVAMAHNIDSDEYSSPSQFFFYLYDKRNAGLGGLSFDEGQFSVFG
ncbi:hypothetical protein GW17_00031104, partial [Ensete ventricosum]